MAFLDAKASRGRFAFVILAIAAGVAALTGVKGFSESVHYTLVREARTLMGADLMIRMNFPPNAKDQEFLDSLRVNGIDHTRVTETVSMTSANSHTIPILASIKAADLAKYPFYGVVEFEPQKPAMADDTAIVSDDLLFRLGVKIGDSIRVGAQEFRIAVISKKEPDRMTTGFTLGPRVLMTREGYKRTGLDIFGSRATQRILLRIPQNVDIESVRRDVTNAFKRRARVIDYTEANPTLSRNMQQAGSFLAMVSLIALIVGGVGVATSIESHIQQRLDHIAIMKCLGGGSRRVMQVYAAQSVMLGIAGSIAGVIAGFAAQAIFPHFLAGYFDVNIDLVLSWKPIIQGMSVGLLTTLLFTLPPLLSIARVRPALIFRRNMEELETRKRDGQMARVASIALIALGIWFIAVWMSGSIRVGSYFAAGLMISLLVLAAIVKAILLGMKRGMVSVSARLSPIVRQGIANLYRPGTHVTAILVALGVGVMFTLTVQLLQGSLLDQLRLSAPPDSPNVFLINVTAAEKDDLWKLLRSQPGILDLLDASPAVAGQLARINGTPVEELELSSGEQRYFRTQFALTYSEDIPKATEILSGHWWPHGVTENLVSVEESAADTLKLNVGDTLEWSVQGTPLAARVASIRRTDAARLGANNQFIVSPVALTGFPLIYYGAIRMQPALVTTLQRVVFDKFPTVTVVNAADVLEIVQSVVDRISITVRFLAGFAILGGVIILASAVAGTRYRRMREVAILKTVGATRRKIVSIFSLEFVVIGLIAGAIGAALACLFSVIIIHRLFHAIYSLPVLPVISSTVLTAFIAVFAGWAASFRILRQKPLEVLRQAEN
jgi:putative ABC transport system permease protein